MKIDLSSKIDEEISIIVNRLVSNNWVQEDVSYVRKDLGFVLNSTFKNKNHIALCLFPKILFFNKKAEVWIQCRLSFEYDYNYRSNFYKDSRIEKICSTIIEEFMDINLTPFYDEDAFRYFFTKPNVKHNKFIDISFFVNIDYPNGFWQNHTIN